MDNKNLNQISQHTAKQHTTVRLLLWFVVGALLIISFYVAITKFFDQDEFEAIHTSWKILQGEKIYIDFFQHHHPLFYYILLPLIKFIGENTATVIAIRILNFSMLVGILAITYFIARRTFGNKIAIITLFLLASAPVFINNTIEIRPDVPQALFGLLSLLFLFIYFDSKTYKHLILAAATLAISFLFLQKAIFLIFLVGIVLIWSTIKKETPSRGFIIFVLVFLLTLSPYYLYLYFNNHLGLYWILNWELNQNFLNIFSPFRTLSYIHKSNVLLSIFYILGLIFVLFSSKSSKQRKIVFLSLGLFAFLFAVRAPYPQYLLPAFPLVAMVVAYSIYSIYKYNQKSIAFIIALSLVVSIYYLFQDIEDEKNSKREQFKKINYVLSLTSPYDFVYDGDIGFNLFRKDIDYFWFSIKPNHGLDSYQRIAHYDYDIYESIEEYKPAVISVEYIGNLEDPRIQEKYTQSSEFSNLYIRKDVD